MFHYNSSTLSVPFYLFFQMKRSTHKNPAGILYPYVVPFSMKRDGGDEKLFMDSLPQLLHKSFLPVSARVPRPSMNRPPLSGLRRSGAGEAIPLTSFPASWTLRFNICIKKIAFVLQLLVTSLPFFSSVCRGAVCLWETEYKGGILGGVLCIIIFCLLFVLR